MSNFTPNPGQQKALDSVLYQAGRFNLIYGGSRSGKTALFVSSIIDRALLADNSRHLIVRKEGSAARRAIAKDTLPKIWSLKYPAVPVPQWKDKDGYFELPNGSQIWIGGLNDEKAMERILGNEYATIYTNEASEVEYGAFLLLRSRLAQVSVKTAGQSLGQPLRQKFYIDLNPTTRMHWTYRLFIDGIDPQDETPIDREQYLHCVINPYDNQLNLSGDYLADLEALPQRQRKRFLSGEYSADDDDALWRRSMIHRAQLQEDGSWPVEMRRIVVAIGPAVSSKPGSDETGIVGVGVGADGRGYVLADDSGRYQPDEWARRAVSLYHTLGADRVIGEVNQGGDMVESLLRAQAEKVPYKAVRASRGKVTRAEPVAALYERGRVYHVGEFQELEDQMCAVTTGFDSRAAGWSPDRVDALVWGFSELFPQLTAKVQQTQRALPTPQFSMV